MPRRPSAALAAACALALALALPALAAAPARRVVGSCTRSQVRPATIVLACADFNAQLTHLRWSAFGGASAHGSGTYTVNDCTPYCAAGRFHSYPVTLVLSDARRCADGYDDYRLAVATFTAKRPPRSGATTGRLELSCPLKG